MPIVYAVTLLGLAAGCGGTALGALLAGIVKTRSRKSLGFAIEFSAGLMLAIVAFELLPEAFEGEYSIPAFLGVALGVALGLLCSDAIRLGGRLSGVQAAGYSVMAGIMLHNFPEGLAIGAGFSASGVLGVSLCIVIALHNIPEGLSMALTLRAGGKGLWRSVFYTFIAGVPMGLGALVGYLSGGIGESITSFSLGCAAGAMLYVVCADMIPTSKEIYKGRFGAIGNILGFLAGILLSGFLV